MCLLENKIQVNLENSVYRHNCGLCSPQKLQVHAKKMRQQEDLNPGPSRYIKSNQVL